MMYLLSRSLTVGDPEDANNKLGALVSKEHMAKVQIWLIPFDDYMWQVQSYIDLAQKEGCTIHCGLEKIELPTKNKNVNKIKIL